MKSRISFGAFVVPAALLLAGCSSSGKTTTADGALDEPELASCTGGNVPVGATNCLLDLETGTDSYWADTDGVAPEVAGCHIEYETDTCSAVRTGREFGEFCLDSDRLVESNPGVDECHTHAGDLGKPAVVSCSAWCAEQNQGGGSCEGGVAVTGTVSCESARCVCNG